MIKKKATKPLTEGQMTVLRKKEKEEENLQTDRRTDR